MTTEPRPRHLPRPPEPGAERPGDRRATALAVLLLAASAGAVTWLLADGRGPHLRAVPAAAYATHPTPVLPSGCGARSPQVRWKAADAARLAAGHPAHGARTGRGTHDDQCGHR
ncbi:hypothetical protein [Streptomyces sp. NRRL F-5755]|uniref:hypothetical protein n=1 Tax=Streptomyces sp. NRRL F-5755 TaxID=1519475 RepID=UPI000A83586C|nr:hypothetical protein [Streptomyces sp. NRRL F-5755]